MLKSEASDGAKKQDMSYKLLFFHAWMLRLRRVPERVAPQPGLEGLPTRRHGICLHQL